MESTQLSILRHGEVEGGLLFRGSQDDPLTDKGWQQLQQSLSSVQQNFDIVVSSPLIRCADFARKYSKDNNLSLEIIPDLKEIDFGNWEGKSFDEINQSEPEKLQSFFSNPTENPAPSGEKMCDFRARVIAAIEQLLVAHSNKNILVVTHGGVLKVIITHALQMPLEALHKVDTSYACMSRFSIYKAQESFSWLLKQHG